MSIQPSVRQAQFRLARHYVDRLKQASRSTRWSRQAESRWLQQIRQDWEQIQKWQAWSVQRDTADPVKARLCCDFTLATSRYIRMRQSPVQTLQWALHALAAARELGDEDSERELLYLVCLMYSTMGQFDAIEPYANRLAVSAQAAHDVHGLSRAWGMLGQIQEFRGNYDEAEALFLKSVELWKYDPADAELLSLWQGLGRIALWRGDYEQAQLYHVRVLEAAKASRREVAVGIAHLSLSGILVYRGDFEAAECHAEQAVAIARKVEFERLVVATLVMLAHTQKWLGKLDSARAGYDEALSRRNQLAPSNLVNALQGRAEVAYLQGDTDEALARLEEALELAPQAAPTNICDVRIDLVYVHVARRDVALARAALRDALEAARQLNSPHFMTRALAAATTVWQQTGDLELAAQLAGLLTRHKEHLQPSLFDRAVCARLESALGVQRYAALVERSHTLTLSAALSMALEELTSSRA